MESTGELKIGNLLRASKTAKVIEILIVFAVGGAVVLFATSIAGENLIVLQGIVWSTSILMAGMVWIGLRLRGEKWEDLGLSLSPGSRKRVIKAVLLSLVVFIVAVMAFLLGSIVGASLAGIPEPADISGYNYFRGNLPILLVALVAVFISSSMGEEIIYRGFLITRLGELGGNGIWAVRITVIVSAAVFGLAHYGCGLMGVIQATFVGLALGISYIMVSRNLWITILAHAYMDAMLLFALYAAPQ